jgi:hypothetical protein
MPGGGRYRFEPTKAVPWPAFLMLALFMINLAIMWSLMATIDRWASRFPTAGHWHEFLMMGGVTYYLSPGMGWYLDNDLWIGFGLFALFFLIAHLGGVRWKRVR